MWQPAAKYCFTLRINWGTESDGEKISTARSGAPLAKPLLLRLETFLANEGDIGSPHCTRVETESGFTGVNPAETVVLRVVVQDRSDPGFMITVILAGWRHRDQFPFVELGSHRIVVGHLLQLIRGEERPGAHIQILYRGRRTAV